jgi:signal transduction histidine kinase
MSSVRAEDTVSRHGGDEFLILLAEVSQISDAVLIADKVIATLGASGRIGDHALRLTASIGISIYPDDGEDVDTLIDRADAAMYRAKRQGLGGVVRYGEESISGRSLEPSASAALPLSVTHHERALAEHERQHAQLREVNQQLVLAALGAEQRRAVAEQAQRRQTELLIALAQQLRNPRAPIRTAALPGNGNTNEPLLPLLQAIIERQAENMSRLLDDLLEVPPTRPGMPGLERCLVDVAGLIDEAVDTCRPAMDARRQHFGVQLRAPRPLNVYGDPVRLAQLLHSLLDNASRCTSTGGEIELAVAVDETIVMTVSNRDIGIAAEGLPHACKPFAQNPQAIGGSGDGPGSGLTLVRELVEAHGGHMASSAGGGLGSQFVIMLPLAGPVHPA